MSQRTHAWLPEACDLLGKLRRTGVGWGYRDAGPAYTEPTVLACLALLASPDAASRPNSLPMVKASASWLADLQQSDGSVGVSKDLPAPRWPTALAVLLWSGTATHQSALVNALRWLQHRQGNTFVNPHDGVVGHDTSISGWPWVEGTHPWLEPTAIAMLALCRNQLTGHQRVLDGVRLILDRSVPGGGWNMGNSRIFGRPLRPQAGPTGIALLALRAAGCSASPQVTKACQYLSSALPTTRAAESLAWGILGLDAWGVRPGEADEWLGESYARSPGLATSPMRLAMLVLGAAPAALAPLGVQSSDSGQAFFQTLP